LESNPPRTVPDAKPKKCRSAVTNGSRLFVEAASDNKWRRRFSDILGEIVSDLGGAAGLSEGQRQLARRCATIALECERMEGIAANGGAIDVDSYGMMTDRLGRAFGRLGLRRQSRDITPPSLDDIARELESEDGAVDTK
jgi:hypothetical protein